MQKKTNMRLPRDATTKRASGQAKGAAKDLPKLTTKEIIAAKLGCEPDELLAYVEKPNSLIIAIAPDGRKFKFTNQEL